MLKNVSKSKLIIGRFHIKPGDTLPGVPLLENEKKGVENMTKAGYLKEVLQDVAAVIDAVAEQKAKPEPQKVEEPAPAPASAPAPAPTPTPDNMYRKRKKTNKSEEPAE